jgi:hypothetical protein
MEPHRSPPPRLQLQEEEEERVWRTKKALAAAPPKCGSWLRHRTHECKRKGERDQFSSSGLANNKGQHFIVHIWQMTLSRCYNEEGCFHTKLTPVRTENGWVNRGRFDTFFFVLARVLEENYQSNFGRLWCSVESLPTMYFFKGNVRRKISKIWLARCQDIAMLINQHGYNIQKLYIDGLAIRKG